MNVTCLRLLIAGSAVVATIAPWTPAARAQESLIPQSPDWVFEVGEGWFGTTVSTAGDVNGDGYSDVIVGAPSWSNGQNAEGAVFLFLGTSSGLADTPIWSFESDHPGANLGAAVAAAGDVNGDGLHDVIVGAPRYDSPGRFDDGAAWVFLGTPYGPLEASPAWYVEGSARSGMQFGFSVSTAGDVNDDGYDDVLVGAPYYELPPDQEGGLVQLFYGGSGGLSHSPGWLLDGGQADAELGYSLSTAGDVNADGIDDIILGSPKWSGESGERRVGRILIFFGSEDGPQFADVVTGTQEREAHGYSVSLAGDWNGDGYGDVVVGAPFYGDDLNGRVWILLGAPDGVDPDFWRVGPAGAALGWRVACAGDANGDGWSDVIFGTSPLAYGVAGEVRLVAGTPEDFFPGAEWTFTAEAAGTGLGLVGPTGDVNGDGFSDLLAVEANEESGRIMCFHGAPRVPGTASGVHSWSLPDGFSNNIAGDLDGDGYSDILTTTGGVIRFWKGRWPQPRDLPSLQFTVEDAEWIYGIGDFDGDGFDDAMAYADPPDAKGTLLLFPGTPSGLSATPSSSFELPGELDTSPRPLAPLGDVNGDGRADVLVSVRTGFQPPTFQYVFLGRTSGFPAAPDWERLYPGSANVTGAAAWDLNGDGFEDLAVPLHDRGEVEIFYGGGSGFASSPDLVLVSPDGVEGFGSSATGSGDVNGDGFSDLVVGDSRDVAPDRSGRILLYRGGASGVESMPHQIIEAPGVRTHSYGSAGFAPGDVNRDGFADLLVGGNKVFLHLGGAAGLDVAPVWTENTPPAGPSLAGDVNGDGYPELITRFDIWPMNGTYALPAARLRRPQQMDIALLGDPVGAWGIPASENAIRFAQHAVSPAGRQDVQIEYSVTPAGVAATPSSIVRRPGSLDLGPPGVAGSAVDENLFVYGLDYGTAHAWRMRLVSDSPFFPRQIWLSHPANSLGDWVFRTSSAPVEHASIVVPEDHELISEAIAAASDGDTVIVLPGAYGGEHLPIDFEGKEIVLRSLAGPEETILDGRDVEGSVVRFVGGEGASARLEGFLITGGSASPDAYGEQPGGGGVRIIGSSPTIRDCVVMENTSQWFGGGVYLESSTSRLEECRILGNQAGLGGGGLDALGGEPTIEQSLIAGNIGGMAGGVGVLGGANVRVERSTIADNYALEGAGIGGLAVGYASTTELSRTIVWSNCGESANDLGAMGEGHIALSCSDVPLSEIMGSFEADEATFEEDPRFCEPASCGELAGGIESYALTEESPCLPEHSPCGELVGAYYSCESPSGPGRVTGAGAPVLRAMPNPFGASTTLTYTIGTDRAVRLEIFDVSGRLVRTLVDGERRDAGRHTAHWDARTTSGSRVAPGVYFYRLSLDGTPGASGRIVRWGGGH